MAVFCPILQSADTTPDDSLLALFGPGATAIRRTTLSADQLLSAGVFAGVAEPARGSRKNQEIWSEKTPERVDATGF